MLGAQANLKGVGFELAVLHLVSVQPQCHAIGRPLASPGSSFLPGTARRLQPGELADAIELGWRQGVQRVSPTN